MEIRKFTTINDYLGGWHFIVKTADGTEIPGSPFISDESGLVRISDLAPGKYLVMEAATDKPFWSVELGLPKSPSMESVIRSFKDLPKAAKKSRYSTM